MDDKMKPTPQGLYNISGNGMLWNKERNITKKQGNSSLNGLKSGTKIETEHKGQKANVKSAVKTLSTGQTVELSGFVQKLAERKTIMLDIMLTTKKNILNILTRAIKNTMELTRNLL